MTLTPKITRFYTRAECGMRAPKSVSYNMHAEDGGVAVHYGGAGPNPPTVGVAACMSLWRGWQNYHMDGQDWNDIAYTAGFDNDGNVYAGRGLGVRCGANGTSFANERFYAFVWLGGGSAQPSEKALCALLWLIKWAREKGKAANLVVRHRKFVSTNCPGVKFDGFIDTYTGKVISAPSPTPTNPYLTAAVRFPLPTGHWYGRDDDTRYSHSGVRGAPDTTNIKKIQAMLNKWLKSKGKTLLSVDGKFGPKTEAACKAWQYANRSKIADHKYNGKFGRNSWNFAF